MTALIVGADALGNLPRVLQKQGFQEVIHWSGRSRLYRTKTIPKAVGKVFLMCDFVNHNVMQSIRNQSKRAGIPVVYGKRSIADLETRAR